LHDRQSGLGPRAVAAALSAALLAGVVCGAPARADDDDKLAAELKQDVILRAMVDELDRSAKELKLPDLADPYFIEFAVQDGRVAQVAASFGALTSSAEVARRPARVDVRVGSYELDNTNFRDGWSFGGGSLPIENDYTAIRQALWWATDREYKQVAETYARKKAFMEQKVIEDKPADFSHEEPVVSFEEPLAFDAHRAELEKIAIAASAVFREFPEVQEGDVQIQAGGGNGYLVNTEGTRLREHGSLFQLTASARVQADDGMELSDSISAAAEKFADFPSVDDIQSRCRELAQRLIRLKNAPRLEEAYAGPVLFDAQPAALMFGAHFSRRFAGGQRPVGARSDPEDFEKKIGKRILPRSVTVVDDATQEKIDGKMVLAHYDHDDQGVPSRKVTLVEGGRLQRLVMSRNPSRIADHSTGHGNGFFRPTASAACLILTSDDAADSNALRSELLEGAQDEDLNYGIRVASLSSFAPLEVYKVFPDGHEELVRGAEGLRLNLRAFKRIVAVGDKPFVLNVSGVQSSQTFAVPALLFEELDVAPVDRDFDKPPLLPSPLALMDKKK